MDEKDDLLVRLALSLRILGNQMEKRRKRMKQLLSQGDSYASPELEQLATEYRLLQSQFVSLEKQFKEVKDKNNSVLNILGHHSHGIRISNFPDNVRKMKRLSRFLSENPQISYL